MPDLPFTIFSGISILLCIPPAYFNWKIPCRLWATLILIGWIAVLNILYFCDSIIWYSGDTSTWWNGKVYCDIDSRIKDTFFLGAPGATIGICRFLADATNPNPSHTDLRKTLARRNAIDFFLGIVMPFIVAVGLKSIVSASRYHVVGVNGCLGNVAHAWPSLVVYHLWIPGLIIIAAGYACILFSCQS